MEQLPGLPPPPTIEHCYRHQNVPTAVHCTRCGRPICTECMIPAPVGHQCPNCVAEARAAYGSRPMTIRRSANSAPVTRALIAILVAVFAFEIIQGGSGSIISGPSSDALVKMGGSVGALI